MVAKLKCKYKETYRMEYTEADGEDWKYWSDYGGIFSKKMCQNIR